MSRILEALRRAEQEHNGASGPAAAEADVVLPNLLRALQTKAPAACRFAPLAYRSNPEHLLVSDGRERAAQAENFRLLRFRLEAWRGREARKAVLVCSAIPREGKTLVAVNLARTFALTGARVLLVDADLRKGGIHDVLGFEPLPGLAEVLLRTSSWRDACREIETLGFSYLPAGRLPGNPAELLRSPLLRQVLQEAAGIFDWIILDSPPLIPFADGRYLAAAADGAVLVARDGHTPAAEMRKALRALESFPLVGIVINGSDTKDASSYYAGYAAFPGPPERLSRREVAGA